MKYILMPTDFSDNSWNAIRYALSMFKEMECVFYLFTVNPIPIYTGAQTSIRVNQTELRDNILKQSESDLQELLKRIKKTSSNKKHKFVTIAEYDHFIDVIRKVVKNNKIQLIVMGTKGASGIKKMVVGSNTSAVISKVDCPLLAVPENAAYEEAREIAFATDFKVPYNLRMLDTLKEMTLLNKAVIRILNVLKKDDTLDEGQIANRRFLSDYLNDFEHSFHTLTVTEVETAIQCFVESRDINMIAMVAKNKNLFQKILFKPTVKKVSYFIDIPLLVLRE